MISRYSSKKIEEVWTDEKKFKYYLQVELATLKVLSFHKLIPSKIYDKIATKATINLALLKKYEDETKHDVIAFIKTINDSLDLEERKWFHFGLTSTDVVDSAYALQYKEINSIIQQDLLNLLDLLKTNAIKYKSIPCIGRTHGIHAEVTSFGLKWLNWYDEMKRNIKRFEFASQNIQTGKISGVVGNHSLISVSLQDEICKELGINSANISTQVLARDIHIEYISTITLIASTFEKIATEIRMLQRTEVAEVFESFSISQKGSSAMPHKKNPILSENICGLARVVKSYINSVLQNNNLWHERDISHSSVERIVMSDATNLIHFMIIRLTKLLQTLQVDSQKMLNNIYLTNGAIFSQKILVELIKKGKDRLETYDLLQKLVFKCSEAKEDLISLCKKETFFSDLTINDWKNIEDISSYLKEVDNIFTKVLK